MQPIFICGQLNDFDCRKPFRRVGCRITERRQLAHRHQNLNIALREAEQFRRRRDIQPSRQISCRLKIPAGALIFSFAALEDIAHTVKQQAIEVNARHPASVW